MAPMDQFRRGVALVAGTPWQVMGAVALRLREPLIETATRCDLYLREAFQDAAGVAGRLRAMGLFDKVLEVQVPVGTSADGRGSTQAGSPLIQEAVPTLLRQVGFNPTPYGAVLSTWPYDTASSLLALEPSAAFMLYDDGMGSYAGDLLAEIEASGFPEPKAIYLASPELYRGALPRDRVRQLPISLTDGQLIKTLCQVFAVDEDRLSCYQGKKLVWLTQPNDGEPDRPKVDEAVFDVLNHWGERLIVRPHPREVVQRREGIAYDETGIPWELACLLGDITEESVLVAECSTAQMTPRTLAGLEPVVVFLADLYASTHQSSYVETEHELIAMVRDSYCDKGRVLVPKSFDDLARCLKTLRV